MCDRDKQRQSQGQGGPRTANNERRETDGQEGHKRHPFDGHPRLADLHQKACRIEVVRITNPLKGPRQQQDEGGRDHPLQSGDPGAQPLVKSQRTRPHPDATAVTDARNTENSSTRWAWRVPARRATKAPPPPAPAVASSSGARPCLASRPPEPRPPPERTSRWESKHSLRACGPLEAPVQPREDLRVDQFGATQLAVRRRPPFGPQHGPEIVTEEDGQGRKDQHQDWVKAIGQARQKRRRGIAG